MFILSIHLFIHLFVCVGGGGSGEEAGCNSFVEFGENIIDARK